ncbi:bifunctional diaminohydroxyphosphoribosylaminopyrimidine deaminase/5-amino-6-(5-phosphoribosylamino)uracil reductase RibD [Rhodanobacter sp. 7MK24]|uniref:bifunctional diaminohydroxyphosphoribosylaminopyrimidine deaminase/5-amino-6-(5-phosphoribosylamino)uracil reductase RibD n=1 Tax=Rhodanobacter sp. 7MK24 TaxID=2775922 RepID=UPI001CE15893|nr:bifunctional diaminohydroxyphosphoribosylaminopyrimidine deaminase/5-amino-6-(5-phosphoribosylamino)uracil reductase RibD [Rhodanobacter sp. 7MK24]
MSQAFTALDHQHMAHALRLAERGLYTTQPNPRVGCVIAHGDEVVGSGWHRRAGEPHAEVHALREAGERVRGATAYVTLEPCAHHGRTPPCTDALVAAGVARVVIAAEDPFPQVAGRGIAKLRAAGMTVDAGLLRDEARELNVGFFSRLERGRPFVRLKLAMSLDGRTALANGESKWITGEAARADGHRWRARSSAILTGSGTVLADDPHLTVRLPVAEAFATPLRVVLDRDLRVPAHFHVMDATAPTLCIHDAQRAPPTVAPASVRHAGVLLDGNGRLDLNAVLALLARLEVNELHVEAGSRLGGALLVAGLVDELLLYVAPVLLGDLACPLLELPPLASMAERWRLAVVEQRQVGVDWRLRLRPQPARPWAVSPD